MFSTLSSRCALRSTVESFIRRQQPQMLVQQQYRTNGWRTFRTIAGEGGTRIASSSSLSGTTVVVAMTIASFYTAFAMSSSTNRQQEVTYLEKIPSSGDVISAGTPVKETSTGILFPPLCNGYYLAGTGVRVKWGLIKVYAVGTYIDPLAMSVLKTNDTAIQQALLDPNYPRTIRIVMNRALSINKYTSAIVDALTPRMKGEDLDKLEEFKALNPPVDLVQGAEMEMTIRGDLLLYKNAVGGVGSIRSAVFCRALCDTYYGTDPVSPSHKESVVAGIKKL